eukprot:TRINITY_DN35267_c0_g2_i1.p1 TRINITY_DN35267_c0_g2~~TRINITY_DN35267_c0_g2_i1.p1  ORF type:complete len:698 (-),score=114.98 TRINITY_DN35267_c0_g2_i1:42-2009(-)
MSGGRLATMPTLPDVPVHMPVAPGSHGAISYMPAVNMAAGTARPLGAMMRPGVPSTGPSPVHAAAPQQAQGPLELACINIAREANHLSLSPDSRRVALALQDHTIQIWDLDAQLLIHVLRGHKYWVNSATYSSDGALLCSASADKSVKVWRAADGQCQVTLSGHLLSVSSVAFSSDKRRVVSGSWDKTVCIWDIAEQRAIHTLSGHTDWVHSVAWLQGGHQVASASSDHSVRVWNAISGVVEQVLVGHLQTVSTVSFSRSGVFLASGSLDGTVRVWNLREGTLAARLQQENDESSVYSVTFSPEGEHVIVGCGDKCVKVWSFRTGEQEMNCGGHEDAVQCVAVTADGQRALSCSHDKTLRVWRLPGIRHALLKASPIRAVAKAAVLPAPQGTLSVLPQQMRPQSPSPGQQLRPAAVQPVQVPGGTMQDLQERLRSSEQVNQRLRRQLSEARGELEERSRNREGLSLEEDMSQVQQAGSRAPSPGAIQRRIMVPAMPAGQQYLSMLPTVMAGSGGCVPPQQMLAPPIPHMSYPAGSVSPQPPMMTSGMLEVNGRQTSPARPVVRVGNGAWEDTNCSVCGNTYMADSKFCRHCGNKRDKAFTPAHGMPFQQQLQMWAEPLTRQGASPQPGYRAVQSFVAPPFAYDQSRHQPVSRRVT